MTNVSWLRPGERDFYAYHCSISKLNALVPTQIYSGDGTLSVMDVRSKKAVPAAHSEDQEDELLSIVAIKGFVPFSRA